MERWIKISKKTSRKKTEKPQEKDEIDEKVEKQEQPAADNLEEDDEADFYISLSHKVRRTIIKIIGTNKTASFTEIKRATNLSTGVVYHHLDQLSKLIQRDEKKRYSLTKMGEHAFRFMDVNLDSIEAKKFEENVDEDKNTIPFYRYVSLNPILEKTKTKPIYQISVCLAIMVIILLLNGYSGLNCYLFFFVERKIYDPEKQTR